MILKAIGFSCLSFVIGAICGILICREHYKKEALEAEVARAKQLAQVQKELNESNLRVKEYENKYQKELAVVNSAAVSKLRVKSGSCMPADSGTPSNTEGGSSGTYVLPDRITEDLFRMTKKADELSARLRLCKDFVNEVELKKNEINRINTND